MRLITALVFACACALASCIYTTKNVKIADNDFLVKQKAILEVFQHFHQPHVHPNHFEDAKNYNMEEHTDCYTKPEVVEHFMKFYNFGFVPQNEIFSVMYPKHREQAIALFDLFYYAKDWDTFYKTMVWARYHVNEDMFHYAMTVAVIHRKDMAGIVLPAPYEINPYYFYNSEVIQEAQLHKMQGFYNTKKVEDTYSVVIPANYTGYNVYVNEESKISYFTEDVGLNSYYHYLYADYPVWMNRKEFGLDKDQVGKILMYKSKAILARYYMERLSNDLGKIPAFSWYAPVKTGHYSDLRYYNGAPFPSRENYYKVNREENYKDLTDVLDTERYLRKFFLQGFITMPDGTHVDITSPEAFNYLGNLVPYYDGPFYSNLTTIGNFGHAKKILGAAVKTYDTHKIIPSVLAHYETSLRDPVIYQYYKYILKNYMEYEYKLPSYKPEEIEFKGVKIESVDMDKLVTYFDKFDADITNAVDLGVAEKTVDYYIKARQWRLNHLPFTTKINVVSDKPQKAVVRLFIGPKQETEYGHVFDVEENRHNFYVLDNWVVDLKEGKNVLTRNCDEFIPFVKDRTTFYELYKNLMLAVKGQAKFELDMTEAHNGFPYRLMLPKGKKGGMPFQFFVIVSPYTPPAVPYATGYDPVISAGVGSGARYIDSYTWGYPLDRKIDLAHWYTPNMYYHEAMIFHKKQAEIN